MIRALVLLLGCTADLFVLRSVLTANNPVPGQFRRGYFEKFDDGVGLSVDPTIRTGMLPSFSLMSADVAEISADVTEKSVSSANNSARSAEDLGVPPGMIAVVAISNGTSFELTSADHSLAPYVVVGDEAAVAPVADNFPLLAGEARLISARTLGMVQGRLALVAWDATRPWHDDVARLTELRASCGSPPTKATVSVRVVERSVDIRLGTCSLRAELGSIGQAPLLAGLAGPDWLVVAREHGWNGDGHRVKVLAGVIAKVLLTWWGLGIAAVAATSWPLGVAAWFMPVPAALTWVLTAAVAVIGAIGRLGWIGLRQLRPGRRLPAGLAMAGSLVAVIAWKAQPNPIESLRASADACIVVGYSAVKGEGLRREYGGGPTFLSRGCDVCRDHTDGVARGGETLAWARNVYCKAAQFPHRHVIFYGGANDDFLWGALAIGRLLVVSQQGIAPWRHNQSSAAAASLARIGEQVAALNGLADCARSHGADLLFLHDFLVTDLGKGRDQDRATMLARRRAAVEASGGQFVDVREEFADEAGISWFNDYVHPSLIGHQQLADLACRRLAKTGAEM